MLKVVDLVHRYGDVPVLRNLSGEFESGRPHLLSGGNGCGKTTLLRVLAGDLRPRDGQILWNGQPRPRGVNWRSRIGFVSSDVGLYEVLTVRENLLWFARLCHVEDAVTAVDREIDAFGLEDWVDEPTSRLSKGWTQRVRLARAWIPGPELFLLDEPFNGLDAGARELLITRLLKAAEQHPVLLATHDADPAFSSNCSIWNFRRGRLHAGPA